MISWLFPVKFTNCQVKFHFFYYYYSNWDQHGKLKQEFLFLFQHEEVAMPYVQLLADFREEVRNVARDEKGETK